MEFAVRVLGLDEPDKARWVIAVDAMGERFLVVHEDKTMHWHLISACEFAKIAPPDAPRPVVLVEAAGQPHPLVLPNRAQRRRMEANGN